MMVGDNQNQLVRHVVIFMSRSEEENVETANNQGSALPAARNRNIAAAGNGKWQHGARRGELANVE
jgi:hypothetical protein